jgi:opacity protein-like surface antigen
MLKKIILCIVIVLLPIVSFARPYVGADLGITANTTSTAGNKKPGNFRGIPVTLFAGYGAEINDNFYLAGEVFVTPGTGELSQTKGHYVKSTYGYGASFIPGMIISDHTLAYARLGLVRSHFDKNDVNATGGQFGLGLQAGVSKNVDVRGEYIFTAYESFNGNTSPKADQVNVGLVYKFT